MKNLSKILFIVALAIITFGCQKNSYTIDGKVGEEWADATVYCYPTSGEKVALDSAQVNANGEFTLKGIQEKPLACVLILQKGESEKGLGYIILESGKISADYSDENGLMISGTENNDLLNQNQQSTKIYRQQLDDLFNQWLASEAGELRKQIENEFDSINLIISNINKEFILQNLNNIVGAFIFSQAELSDSEQEEILNQAGETFLAEPSVQKIAERITKIKKVAIGQQFTDFEMHDLNGNLVKLSDFVGNGKYLVVDFWASWCGPCRRAMPDLKALYKKYNNKIDIVGVSFDKDGDAWKECVADLELPWHHMSDLQGWQSKGAEIYGVNSIPHLLIIDPNGIIFERNKHTDWLADFCKTL